MSTVPAIRTFFNREYERYGMTYRVSKYIIDHAPYHLSIMVDQGQIYVQEHKAPEEVNRLVVENTKAYDPQTPLLFSPCTNDSKLKVPCQVPIEWIQGCIQVTEARQMQKTLIKQEPLPNDQLKGDCKQLNKEANDYIQKKQYDLAIVKAREAVASDPENFIARFTLAEALQWSGLLEEAIGTILDVYTLPRFETPMQIEEWVWNIYELWDKEASVLLPNIYQDTRIVDVIDKCKNDPDIISFSQRYRQEQ